jgi:hypothetical protein
MGRRAHLGCRGEFTRPLSNSHQLTCDQIFSIFQNAAVIVGVNKGLGKTIDDVSSRQLVEIQKVPFYLDPMLRIILINEVGRIR